jgi:hypothetical protein
MDEFPLDHPTLDNINVPALSQGTKSIIFNINADFQARKITIQALLKLMKAFKYD